MILDIETPVKDIPTSWILMDIVSRWIILDYPIGTTNRRPSPMILEGINPKPHWERYAT